MPGVPAGGGARVTAYYNEHDKFAAAWLRELIKAKLIADGDVDERDIQEVKGSDLDGYTQVHFFAGIGGWSYALRLAGWPDDRPVWTGSCPCQPFSSAGKRKGEADARHLWPEMLRLISERSPAICFGEQVASDDGCQWLAGVFADLEELEYRVAGADLCAAGEGAPHIRQRIFWMANASIERLPRYGRFGEVEISQGWEGTQRHCAEDCSVGGVANTKDAGRRDKRSTGLMGQTKDSEGRRGHKSALPIEHRCAVVWDVATTIPCRDNKTRRVEPSIFPLAHGIPNRVGILRGAGNAIVPQVAARFIQASIEVINEQGAA